MDEEPTFVRVNEVAKQRIDGAMSRAAMAEQAVNIVLGAVAAQAGIDLSVKDNGWSYDPDLGAFLKKPADDEIASITPRKGAAA